MPKVIDIDVRKIVIKVKEHFSKEREQLEPIAFEKINERLAAATGLSLRTISRITKVPDPSRTKKFKLMKHKNHIPNEKIKKSKKLLKQDTLADVYLDERNSVRVGPELTEEFWKKVNHKETDAASDPLPESENLVTVHVSGEPVIGEPSSEENSRIIRTEVTIETTTTT